MNIDFSSLDYAINRYDIYQGDKFVFEENTLTFTIAGFSVALIRRYHDMTESEYDSDSVATYFSLLADKIELAVILALNENSRNNNEFSQLRNRIVNLCWILEDLVIVSKEMEAGKPFKELEIRFWRQRMELACSQRDQEPCILHPSVQNLLSDNPDIRSALYIKLYPFSEDSLNVMTLGVGVITGKISNVEVSPHTLFMLLEHHSTLGDEKAQERLYNFLKKPIGKSNFVDLKKATALLESALKQEKMWALKVKIKEMEEGKNNSTDIIPLYILAAHKGDMDSQIKMACIFGLKVNICMPENENLILKNYSIKKYMSEGFGPPWKGSEKSWRKYGVPLRSIGVTFYEKGSYAQAMMYFEPAALLGDTTSMSMLGCIKMLQGCTLDALYWNRLAAKKGNREGMEILGSLEKICFEGHVPNMQEALKWYTSAAYQGSINGCYWAGKLELQEFEGHVSNPQRAMSFLTYAAENGNSDAMFCCGALEWEINPLKTLDLWTKAAELGNSDAMVSLGGLEKENFIGHSADLLKALHWFTKASMAGNVIGMVHLAELENQEFPMHLANPTRALEEYIKAANAGHAGAMNNAGLLEEKDFANHKASPSRALGWFRKSAEKGMLIGMSNVARVAKKEESLKWASRAGKEGHLECMLLAGHLEAEKFKGHVPNYGKSLEFYTLAAAQGSSVAMYNAGVIETLTYDGHAPNLMKALEWYKKAAALGLSDAMFQSARLEAETFEGHISDRYKALELVYQAVLAENTDAMCFLSKLFLAANEEKYIGQALLWLKKAQSLGSSEAEALLCTALNVSKKNDKEILGVVNPSDSSQKAQLLGASVSLSIQKNEQGIKEVHEQNNHELFLESDVSEESEEVLELELSGYPDFSQHKSIETNALSVKIKFDKICEINEKLEKFQVTLKGLSKKNQLLWKAINDESCPIVTISDLIQFADDNAFVGNFSYGPTKKGIMFCLANKLNGIEKFGTVSTHRKHNKSYKGVDKKFLEEFRQMVCAVLGFE